MKDLHTNNQLYAVILVSVWEVGEGVGPLLLGPLSELYGRLPIFHTANICFVICAVACGLSTNVGMLIAFRCLNGLTVASVVLGPSIIGDMFIQEARGAAMAITLIGPIIGPIAGPPLGGYIADRIGWRWNFWIVAIAAGVFELFFFMIFQETYPVQILKMKVRRARKIHQTLTIRSKYDNGRSATDLFKQAIFRPLTMMFSSPVILVLCVYMAVVYGYLYIILTTMTEIFENIYGFSAGSSGLSLLGMGTYKRIKLIPFLISTHRF